MPANEDRKYTQIIDYVVDQVGADVDRDLLKVAIGAQDDPSALDQNIKSIGGTDQSGGDLIAALQSVSADDELRLRLFAEDDSGNLSEIQGEELGTTLTGTETAVVTSMAEVLETVGNTEARVSVYAEDSAGSLQAIQAGTLDTAPNGTETAVVTVIARALSEVGQTEVRTRVHGVDDAGTLQEAQVESLASGVADGTYAQLTYLARALNSKSLDEFVSRVTDSTGSQIDPLTQDSTQAVGNTELRSRVFGPDSGGALQQVNTEAFDTALAATDIGLATYMARALEGVGEDHLQAALYADGPNNALSRLNVNSNGELRTDAVLDAESVFIDADDDDGNTINPNAETLSESIADPDGLLTYLARALDSFSEDELRARVHDSAGTQVDPTLATRYFDSGRSGYDLIAQGDLTLGPGSVERGTAVVIAGTSTDNNAFSVSVEWQDAGGDVYQTEPAADIGLDTITEDYARLVRKAPEVLVTVTDESGAAQNNINIYADTQR